MKKITIILILLASITITAQTLPTAKTYKQQDSLYWENSLQLIKPQITTGILYNKVSPISNLYNFNRGEYNTVNASLFKQALSEMHRASDNQSQFISINELKISKKQIHLSKGNPAIPIVEVGVLNTSFNFLFYDENNEDNGGLKLLNNIYTPISGKTSIFTKHITLISPQQEIVTASNDGTVSFKLNNAFYFNKDKQIKNLTANFGSSTVTLINNEVLNTNVHNETYTEFGKKIIEFHITYTDNSTLTTYAKIKIISLQAQIIATPVSDCAKTNVISYTSTIPYQAWDEQTAINGRLEYKIFFADNNLNGNCDLSRIKKPFIVIDGFDPGDTRRIELTDCDPICQALNENTDDEFVPEDYKSIYSLMTYNNGDDSIIEELLEENYDVIIINLPTDRTSFETDYEIIHDYGADFIQRNAMTLTSFIKEVNTNLTQNSSTEELVVVGPSMGGQITRYALAYMEKKENETNDSSWNHNTRLWLSMDSPHQGANIPLAIQGSIYFLGFINQDDKAKKQYKEKLRSPAAKQMLIDHYDYFFSTTKSPYFLNYQADLVANGVANSNGYPENSRNIAMVNGSIAGTNQGTYEGARFLDMRGYIDLSWFIFNWTINVMTIKNNYQQAYNQSGMVFDVRAYRQGWNFYNSLSASKTNTNWQGSLDIVPGGYFNSGNDLKEEIVTTLSEMNIRRRMIVPMSENGTVTPHAFIPTHSGLDTNGFSDWYQPIIENLVCTEQTPFDNYYGAENNTDHVSFTQESKNWLFDELDADQFNGPFPSTSVYLTENDLLGTSILCFQETETYYFDGSCAIPSNITWSVSPNLTIIQMNNSTITVQANTQNGSGYVEAIFSNQTLKKDIWIGKPTYNQHISGGEIFTHLEIRNNTHALSKQNITNVTWTKTGGNGLFYVEDDFHAFARGSFGPNGNNWYVYGTVSVTNSCGTTTQSFTITSPPPYGTNYACQGQPSMNDLRIEKIDNNKYTVLNICNGETEHITISELYDIYGTKKQDFNTFQEEMNINYQSNSGDIRIIKVNVNGGIMTKTIIVD